MKGFIYDTRIGENKVVDKFIKINSQFVDIIPVFEFHNFEVMNFRQKFRNFSPNSAIFERFCLERYFHVRSLILRSRMSMEEEFFLLDSDVCIINENFINRLPKGLCLSQNKLNDVFEPLLSPHCSKWNLTLLSEFCDFIMSFYESDDETLDKHLEIVQRSTNGVSGISDMYLLYIFSSGKTWVNTNQREYGILHNLKSDYVDAKVHKVLGINDFRLNSLTLDNVSVIHYQGGLGKILGKQKKVFLIHLIILGILAKIIKLIR